jgi:hypothetical protein
VRAGHKKNFKVVYDISNLWLISAMRQLGLGVRQLLAAARQVD